MHTEPQGLGALDAASVEELVRLQAADVLGLRRVEASENFFNLGGDSVRAGRLVMRLAKALPREAEVDLQDVFAAGDFRELARQVSSRLGGGESIAEPGVTVAHSQEDDLLTTPTASSGQGGRRPVPLSYGQLRRLQRDADSGGSRIAHHVSRTFRVHGRLDLKALQAAAHALVERHESLRTVFDLDSRRGAHSAQRVDSCHLDLSRLFTVRRLPSSAVAQEEATVERVALFNLSTEAKIRILVLLDDTAATLVVTAEHLVCDGDSFTVLLRELAALYKANLGTGQPFGGLAALPPRCWAEEEGTLHLPALERRLDHWRTRLDPLEALPEVRLTGMRDPAVWPTTAAQVHGRLPAYVVRRLRETCATRSSTLFSGFVAALAMAVLADTGHTVPGLVSPTSGRPPGWEDEVDWFATSVIHRFRINTQLSVSDVLDSAKQSVASGIANAVPLPLLLEHLQFNRDLEQRWRPWLYLAVDSEEESPLPLHGVEVESPVADARLALRAGLTVRIEIRREAGQDLDAAVQFQYEQEVWSAARAEAFMQTLLDMAALVAENPSDIDVATLLRTRRPQVVQ
ncbi:condensation domain-containing protein [Streptomyces sp. NPDC012508]|uniref:condensation domain-containing protein n=1 Tax=Streptomyces sp. NPDC012508 TaxID=3364837 RepID=UPI00367A342D